MKCESCKCDPDTADEEENYVCFRCAQGREWPPKYGRNLNPVRQKVFMKCLVVSWMKNEWWFTLFGYGISVRDIEFTTADFSVRLGCKKEYLIGNKAIKLIKTAKLV